MIERKQDCDWKFWFVFKSCIFFHCGGMSSVNSREHIIEITQIHTFSTSSLAWWRKKKWKGTFHTIKLLSIMFTGGNNDVSRRETRKEWRWISVASLGVDLGSDLIPQHRQSKIFSGLEKESYWTSTYY